MLKFEEHSKETQLKKLLEKFVYDYKQIVSNQNENCAIVVNSIHNVSELKNATSCFVFGSERRLLEMILNSMNQDSDYAKLLITSGSLFFKQNLEDETINNEQSS